MDKTALVDVEVDKGARILQILDDAGFEIKVALWAYLGDYEDWRLVLASRKFDAAGLRDSYGRLHKALDKAGIPLEQTPVVVILRIADPFVKALRRSFAKAKSIEGMRLGGQTIGNRYLDDAYVYRVS